MGKKKLRSSSTSKGLRRSISKETLKLMKSNRHPGASIENKIQAWREGKNPWITVPGITKRESWVRRRANDLYGSPKYLNARMYGVKDE